MTASEPRALTTLELLNKVAASTGPCDCGAKKGESCRSGCPEAAFFPDVRQEA